jgi:hypothetical protein
MINQTIVCTVFEGHYHKGVAALVNSLYAQGYKGIVWVGYKGTLPPWAHIEAKDNTVERMQVRPDLYLHFIQLPSTAFLPYCKPDFILQIWENHQPEAQNALYIDCDIVIKCPFSYFEEWVQYGVALCEDMDSPIPVTHPLRYQWASYFKQYGLDVKAKDNLYVNGGFVGVNQTTRPFLKTWQNVQNIMLEDLKEVTSLGMKDRTYRFMMTDQDALNIAKDMSDLPFSIANGSAMDFSNFGYIMSHAAGKHKPWQKNWLKHVFTLGHRPTMTDRLFMNHTETPLSIYTPQERFLKKTHLKLATVMARVFT